LIGKALGDVILTGDEVAGLMGDLLVSGQAPTCDTRLTDWIRADGRGLGERYASEVSRHYEMSHHHKEAAA
jgi:NADH dehydrogenase